MKHLLTVFLLITSSVMTANSQQDSFTSRDMRLDKGKPTVFLTFEKWGGPPPRIKTPEYGQFRISLRLHNNTSFPIAIDADGDFTQETLVSIMLTDGTKEKAVPNGSYVEVCYEAEAVPQKSAEEYGKVVVPKQIPSAYSCKWRAIRAAPRVVVWIESGNSVVFSVPAVFLNSNLKLSTQFIYEWESDRGQVRAGEPRHHVYFYADDLPNHVKKQIIDLQ